MATNSTSSALSAISLAEVTYLHPGQRGVRELSLTLEPGGILALLGPNGSGKSTILSLVAGFRAPQQGSVRVLGSSVEPELRRRIGMVFQESSLDELMTVRETLWLHGRLFGLGGRDLRTRIDELLDLIGLADRAGDRVEILSGGLKRRLELARAILHQPDLILLDEPSLGLDPDSKARLWETLLAVNAEGASILLATNDVSEAERYGRHVAFLDNGRLIASGAAAELKRDLRRDSVQVDWPGAPADLAATLAAWPGVGGVTTVPPLVHATVDDASVFVPSLFQIAGGAIEGIRIHESTLEDAYFRLVGQSLDGTTEETSQSPAETPSEPPTAAQVQA